MRAQVAVRERRRVHACRRENDRRSPTADYRPLVAVSVRPSVVCSQWSIE